MQVQCTGTSTAVLVNTAIKLWWQEAGFKSEFVLCYVQYNNGEESGLAIITVKFVAVNRCSFFINGKNWHLHLQSTRRVIVRARMNERPVGGIHIRNSYALIPGYNL